MLDDATIIGVTNISSSIVTYALPELNVTRTFEKNERKTLPAREIRTLNYKRGGKILIRDYLRVESTDLLAEFGVTPEPEYDWNEADVKNLLLNGSLAELKDALDLAPEGIVDQIKDLGFILEISDMSKREAIAKKTGFNITNALKAVKDDEVVAPEADDAKVTGRRAPVAAPVAAEPKPERRVVAPAYKVVG